MLDFETRISPNASLASFRGWVAGRARRCANPGIGGGMGRGGCMEGTPDPPGAMVPVARASTTEKASGCVLNCCPSAVTGTVGIVKFPVFKGSTT